MRKLFWETYLPMYAPEMGGGGGTGTVVNNNQNGKQQNPGENGSGSGENSLELSDNPWDTDEDESSAQRENQGQNQNNNNNQNNNPAPQKTSQEKIKEMLDGLDFGIGDFDIEALVEKKDKTGLEAALKAIGQKAYMQAVSHTIKYTDNKIASAVDTAVQKATAGMRGNNAMEKMKDALPFARDKSIAPVAENVFANFMKKTGNNFEKAVEKTKAYFEKTSQAFAKATNQSILPKGKSGSGSGGSDLGSDTDWEDFLGVIDE